MYKQINTIRQIDQYINNNIWTYNIISDGRSHLTATTKYISGDIRTNNDHATAGDNSNNDINTECSPLYCIEVRRDLPAYFIGVMSKPQVPAHSNNPYNRYITNKYDGHTEVIRAKYNGSYTSNNAGNKAGQYSRKNVKYNNANKVICNISHTHMTGVGDNVCPLIQTGIDINHLAVDSDTEKSPSLIINENKHTE